MSSSQHAGEVEAVLSPESISALRAAFRLHLSGPPDTAAGQVSEALSLICEEARENHIPAERLLVAFKGVWSALTEVRQLPPHEAAEEVRDLVTLCIERYYAPV
jgi:hypothetical protein